MNVSMNTNSALAQSANDEVGLAVLKKAMDIEARNAMALLDAIPQPAKNPANLPPHLGQNINTTA